MVQNLSAQNQMGTVQRIGTTENGRIIYKISDSEGKKNIKMSVAAKDADVFEKSYKDIVANAPKLQKYAEQTSPEKIEKQQKITKWSVAACTAIGGLIPAIKAKGGFGKQLLFTVLGAVAGFASSVFIASKIITPPGAKEFTTATQNLSKLDIKPIN